MPQRRDHPPDSLVEMGRLVSAVEVPAATTNSVTPTGITTHTSTTPSTTTATTTTITLLLFLSDSAIKILEPAWENATHSCAGLDGTSQKIALAERVPVQLHTIECGAPAGETCAGQWDAMHAMYNMHILKK